MDILFTITVAIVVSVWTVRPLYNFFAKNKYILLDQEKYNLINQVKAGLPAVVFYLILIGFLLVPAQMKNLLDSGTTATVIVLEILLIFALTRIDKFQSKYGVNEEGMFFRRRFIRWDSKYTIVFRKSVFVVLHKPRFVVYDGKTKIVIPVLSKNISKFVEALHQNDPVNGALCKEIIHNARLYFVMNPKIQKQLNKVY